MNPAIVFLPALRSKEPAAGHAVGESNNSKSVRVDMGRRLSFAQCAAWAIVIGGHLLLILLLSNIRPRTMQVVESDAPDRSILLLDLTPPVASPPADKPKPKPTAAARPRERPDPESSGESYAITEPTAIPPIDWYSEAERAARVAGDEWVDPNPPCRGNEQPGSVLHGCRAPKPPAEWEPEPAKAGIDGLLPWVRLGKRCIVGLGFFGCGIGKLPEANGDVFDDMRDPDRQRSSVPEVAE